MYYSNYNHVAKIIRHYCTRCNRKRLAKFFYTIYIYWNYHEIYVCIDCYEQYKEKPFIIVEKSSEADS